MKIIHKTAVIAILFLAMFGYAADSVQAQFAPPKVCRTDNFEIAPLATSTTTRLQRLRPSASNEDVKNGMINTTATQKVELRVFDVFGVMMFRRLLDNNFSTFEIDLSNFAAGVYVVEVREGCDVTTTKVIRRHH
jgi:hypothetical protein